MNYQLIYDSLDRETLCQSTLDLGIWEYPHELRSNDVVILSNALWEKIYVKFPKANCPQMWVGGVHHFLGDSDVPTVFLVSKNPWK